MSDIHQTAYIAACKERDDLRSRLADAQARAERAEGEVERIARMAHDSAVEMAASYLERIGDYGSESKANSIRGEAFDDWRAFKERHLTTPAPQGRTDGERLEWMEKRTLFFHWFGGYKEVVMQDYNGNKKFPSIRAAIDAAMDATAPEVKGGAA